MEGDEMEVTKKPNRTIRRPKLEDPKPRRFVPKPCSACAAIRPEGKSYSSVTGTINGKDDILRYCRCGFCGHQWTEHEKRPAVS